MSVLKKDDNIIKNINYIWGLAIVDIIAYCVADQTSLLSYGYSLLLLIICSFFISKHEKKDLFFAFHFYVFFAIVIYSVLLYIYPEYMGLNGGDYVMDDHRYYAQIVDGRVSYISEGSIVAKYPYSIFLSFIYPFYVYTPLNIETVNVIFLAFLPIFTRRLSLLLTGDSQVGYYTFIYSMLCPFTLYFGCLIMREAFTALMVIMGMCCYLEKKYIPLSLCVSMLVWIRFGTLVFLICGIILLLRFQMERSIRRDFYFSVAIILVIVTFFFFFDVIQEFSGGKLEDSIIRSTDNGRYADSTIGALMKMPFPLNIFLSTLFFLFIPFLIIPNMDIEQISIPVFFQGFLTPIFMFFLWNYAFNASLVAIYEKHADGVKKILYMSLIFALLLGTISMQSRHKTVLFPIMCMLAAYGKVNYNKKYDHISLLMAFILIGVQLIYGLFHL